jgi:hypothetical protein
MNLKIVGTNAGVVPKACRVSFRRRTATGLKLVSSELVEHPCQRPRYPGVFNPVESHKSPLSVLFRLFWLSQLTLERRDSRMNPETVLEAVVGYSNYIHAYRRRARN